MTVEHYNSGSIFRHRVSVKAWKPADRPSFNSAAVTNPFYIFSRPNEVYLVEMQMARRLRYICERFQGHSSTLNSTSPALTITRSYSGLEQARDDHASRAENCKASEDAVDEKVPSKSKNPPETGKDDDKHGKRKEYYSLKNYREGPNTESGEVDTRFKDEVRAHNKGMQGRRGKH